MTDSRFWWQFSFLTLRETPGCLVVLSIYGDCQANGGSLCNSQLSMFSLLFPQTERAYQKQPTIFQNKKRVLTTEGGKEVKEKLPRYHKSVGLGFKTPREVKWNWPNKFNRSVYCCKWCFISRWSSEPSRFWGQCLLALLMPMRDAKVWRVSLVIFKRVPFFSPHILLRLLMAPTLTRNARSLEMSPFVDVSSLVSLTLIVCQYAVSDWHLWSFYKANKSSCSRVNCLVLWSNLGVQLFVTLLQMMFFSHDGLPNHLGYDDSALKALLMS